MPGFERNRVPRAVFKRLYNAARSSGTLNLINYLNLIKTSTFDCQYDMIE
jgi:hypothetical protein